MLVDIGFGFSVALACCLFLVPWTWIVVTLRKVRQRPSATGQPPQPLTRTELTGFGVRGVTSLLLSSFGVILLVHRRWLLALFFFGMTVLTGTVPALLLSIRLQRR